VPIPTAHAVSGNRKYAAALQALRKCLRQQPEALCKALEDNMEADFQPRSHTVPSASAVQVTARARLDMRRRVQGYQTQVWINVNAADVSAATMLSRFSYLPADLPNLQLQLCRTPSTRQKAARVSSTLLAVLP